MERNPGTMDMDPFDPNSPLSQMVRAGEAMSKNVATSVYSKQEQRSARQLSVEGGRDPRIEHPRLDVLVLVVVHCGDSGVFCCTYDGNGTFLGAVG
jgi:hypothetical protein